MISDFGGKQIEVNSRGDILLCNGSNLRISTDYGNNWQIIFTNSFLVLQKITVNDDIYISGAYDMWKSTNYGINWDIVEGVTQPYYIEFNSLGDIYILSWGNGIIQNIYKSTNGGLTWDSIFTSTDAVTEFYCASNDNFFVAVRSEGIYRTTDSGENWENLNSGLINYFNYGINEDNNGYLFVSTFGDGVFKSLTSISGIEDEKQFIDFNLSQNYPNPFNPSTTIKYSIPNAGNISLKVYDVLGKEIATLVNEEKSSGNYEVEFNASNLTSGIYFYQLKAGNFIETKKMILLR